MRDSMALDNSDVDSECDKAARSPFTGLSGFVAINSPPRQALPTQLADHAIYTPGSERHLNKTVANYLGRGADSDSSRFLPSSPPLPAPATKRPRIKKGNGNEGGNRKERKTSRKKPTAGPKQKQVSDDFPVTKPMHGLTPVDTPKPLDPGLLEITVQGTNYCDPTDYACHNATSDLSGGHGLRTSGKTQSDDEDTQYYSAMSLQSSHVDKTAARTSLPNIKDSVISSPDDEAFDDDIDEEELLILMDRTDVCSDPVNRSDGLENLPTDLDASHPFSVQAHLPSDHVTLSVSLNSDRPLDELDVKPIVRTPFPEHVKDRSPIIGLSADCVLRTCFRIGEALNAGRSATRNGRNVIVELYARVLKSERNNAVQHFLLGDLFHSNKPYIEADYSAAIWQSVQLYELDSRVFLGEGNRMCRCILVFKSNGKECVPTILNIWAAKKEDIMWVEGIVNA